MRVNTPYGPATVVETIETEDCPVTSIYVELDTPHRSNNRDYSLWLFNETEVTTILPKHS